MTLRGREETVRRIKITIGPVELHAKLLDTPAGNAIRDSLPFLSKAQVADNAVVFSAPGPVPQHSGQPSIGRPGDFVLCGRSKTCGIDFETLPFTRNGRRAARGTSDVWARAIGDIAALKHVIDGDRVTVRGVD
ncbi:MAG: hypothetical protein JSU82_16950 [Rhodospirillales bacterium]|nr:MAG: hypothetical protein JSU82_16950 [Rhodospirillales bacterium]